LTILGLVSPGILLVFVIGIYHSFIAVFRVLWGTIFSSFLPAVTAATAIGVISAVQPVNALLCLILTFFATVIFYVHIGAEFLGLSFLIIYVGAVAVLFLFVMMLLFLKKISRELTPVLLQSVVAGSAIFYFTVIDIATTVESAVLYFTVENFSFLVSVNTESFSALVDYLDYGFRDISAFRRLYTEDSFLFFLISFLLLVAMLGAIVLATGAISKFQVTARFYYLAIVPSCSEPRYIQYFKSTKTILVVGGLFVTYALCCRFSLSDMPLFFDTICAESVDSGGVKKIIEPNVIYDEQSKKTIVRVCNVALFGSGIVIGFYGVASLALVYGICMYGPNVSS
jgi:NADH:ubiquinone oxidoreductase subunit 6 (subunit J)